MRVHPSPPIESILLTWCCDGCGEPISDGAGWIEISCRELAVADPTDLSDPVRWMAWHRGCDPDLEANSYRMAIGRVRNLAQLIELHEELTSETWHSFTDFCDLRLFLGKATGSPTSPQSPRSLYRNLVIS